MVRPIMKDVLFLGQKSLPATPDDISVADDLLDTLRAHTQECVGMAANMIGVKKRIIVVNMGFLDLVMYNPGIIRKDEPFEAEEGCLSLDGVRKTTRYANIEVEFLDGVLRLGGVFEDVPGHLPEGFGQGQVVRGESFASH